AGESSRRNFRNRSTVVSTPAILGLSESKPFGLIRWWPLRLCEVCCVGKLADGSPGAVRIAARSAAGGLRLAINIAGVGKSTAFAVSLLIRSTRDNCAVATGIRISPGNRGPWLASVEGIHLCRVGALLVFVVKRRATSVADQTTDRA